MTQGIGLDLIVPAIVLALVGWAVPRFLFHLFPEGVKPLMLLALCAAAIMMAFGMMFFAVLYLANGITWDALMEDGFAPLAAHFLKLGAISALLWGPVMLLSVASLPRRWKKEVW